jgi:ABC-type sugar transport system substrate-binding protein
MAFVSDLELPPVRPIGIDNRAAGNVAAYLMGRHLEGRSGAQVAVVVGSFSYRCHEDREIGFRSIMRQQFESVEVLEVIKGEDSDEATYDAARKLLQGKPNIAESTMSTAATAAWPRRLPSCNLLIVRFTSLTS